MSKLLFFAGRVELVKSMLLNFLSYWVQSFRIPNFIIIEFKRMLPISFGIVRCMFELNVYT